MVKRLAPALVALVLAALAAGLFIWYAGGDPMVLVRVGGHYARGEPITDENQGYDGQFVYYIARDLQPQRVSPHLDVPAYRYQRILLPLLARALSLGNIDLLPWALAALGVLSVAAGTWVVSELLDGWGINRWYALVYGTWAGFLLAVVVDLPEPLAYGLAAGGLLALEREHRLAGWVLLGLSVFAKETTALFVAAVMLTYLVQRRWTDLVASGLVGALPYALFQAWLWWVFGQPGVGSGGAMATPFEIVPFMGLLRIGQYSLVYLLAMALVFVPAVVLPCLWGLWKAGRSLLAGETGWVVTVLLVNALVIPFTPFSTFRETGGMLRFACGLVMGVLFYAARYHQRRVLNYTPLWIVLNVFLLK